MDLSGQVIKGYELHRRIGHGRFAVVMCVIGSYAIRNSVFDVYTLAACGLMGYLLLRVRIPVTPVVLGLVLGPTLESQYRTAFIMSEGHYSIFYTSATALFFFALALLVIVFQLWSNMRAKAQAVEAARTTEQEA